MINLEKNYSEKCQPPPPPFKKTCGGGGGASERCRILALSGNHPWKPNTRIRPQYLKIDLCSKVQMGDHDLKKYDNISQN